MVGLIGTGAGAVRRDRAGDRWHQVHRRRLTPAGAMAISLKPETGIQCRRLPCAVCGGATCSQQTAVGPTGKYLVSGAAVDQFSPAADEVRSVEAGRSPSTLA